MINFLKNSVSQCLQCLNVSETIDSIINVRKPKKVLRTNIFSLATGRENVDWAVQEMQFYEKMFKKKTVVNENLLK